MKQFFAFLMGAFIGALIGAVLALLFTPRSGEELRQQVRSRVEQIAEDIRSAVEDERKRLEEEFAALKSGEIRLA